METSKDVKYRRRTRVQISASEASQKISRLFLVFVTTFVTFLNYTLASSGNHTQNIQITGGNPVRAHMGDFIMVAAGRAFGPTRAAPGISVRIMVRFRLTLGTI